MSKRLVQRAALLGLRPAIVADRRGPSRRDQIRRRSNHLRHDGVDGRLDAHRRSRERIPARRQRRSGRSAHGRCSPSSAHSSASPTSRRCRLHRRQRLHRPTYEQLRRHDQHGRRSFELRQRRSDRRHRQGQPRPADEVAELHGLRPRRRLLRRGHERPRRGRTFAADRRCARRRRPQLRTSRSSSCRPTTRSPTCR